MRALLENRVAIVTGGASGIGRATALVFSREGARIAVVDRAVEEGEKTVRLIHDTGGDSFFIECDVSREADVERMVGLTVDTYGRLDCALNNAGMGMRKSTIDLTEQDWNMVMNVNLKSVWLCMKYEILQMLRGERGGAIVNTSSGAGLLAPELGPAPAYTASKHGVIGLTKAAALEHGKDGIRINAVCPGAIRTPLLMRVPAPKEVSIPDIVRREAEMRPMNRIGEPEEVAASVLWLCSEGASFVTGVALAVDGGRLAIKQPD
jgi:NAD(P)-dependent dehydrogenase (short-subunit alcohol dehydrogenase family)